MGLSDNEDNPHTPSQSPSPPIDQLVNGEGLKRKRDLEEGMNGIDGGSADVTPSKRVRSMTPPAPPPPPPPPAGIAPTDESIDFPDIGEEPASDEAAQSPFKNGTAHVGEGDSGDPQLERFQTTDNGSPESHWHLNNQMVGPSGAMDDEVL